MDASPLSKVRDFIMTLTAPQEQDDELAPGDAGEDAAEEAADPYAGIREEDILREIEQLETEGRKLRYDEEVEWQIA
ncbi:MAG: hypothetical protein ACM3UX_00855, partial [Candidatus Woesearchaeota archaeon]